MFALLSFCSGIWPQTIQLCEVMPMTKLYENNIYRRLTNAFTVTSVTKKSTASVIQDNLSLLGYRCFNLHVILWFLQKHFILFILL